MNTPDVSPLVMQRYVAKELFIAALIQSFMNREIVGQVIL